MPRPRAKSRIMPPPVQLELAEGLSRLRQFVSDGGETKTPMKAATETAGGEQVVPRGPVIRRPAVLD